jgi:hypothetical protein
VDVFAHEVPRELFEHRDRRHVDERHSLGVKDDRTRMCSGDGSADLVADVVGVGKEKAALRPDDDEAGYRYVVFVAGEVGEVAAGAGDVPELGDMGRRGPGRGPGMPRHVSRARARRRRGRRANRRCAARRCRRSGRSDAVA